MRASARFSAVGDEVNMLDTKVREDVLKGLSCLIAEKAEDERKIERALMKGTDEEIRVAMETAFSLIANKDFFVYAGVAREIANLSVSPAERQ